MHLAGTGSRVYTSVDWAYELGTFFFDLEHFSFYCSQAHR